MHFSTSKPGVPKSHLIPGAKAKKQQVTPDKMVRIIEKKSINQKKSEGFL